MLHDVAPTRLRGPRVCPRVTRTAAPAAPLLLRGMLVASLLIAGVAAAAEPGGVSLATRFPAAQLQALLLPGDSWRPYPKISDRTAWAGLPAELRERVVAAGEAALGGPVPFLPATLYLEYAREGNRARFEAVHRKRRAMLHALVLAECVERQGRFLDAIADVAWAIAEESTWCYPAHISAQRAGVGLPDVDEPIVALFSAETAVSLAWSLYLLDADLDQVSARIRPRLAREIDRRILTPFLERDDFGWMAFHKVTRTHRPNNWNPWINASVMTAGLLVEADPGRRAQIAHKVLRSVDRFLLAHPRDGSCDEGPGYWGHAGGSLFDTLELLYSASGGRCDVFSEPLIREIGRFLYRAHIHDDYYIPVGDCSAHFRPYQALVFQYGRRIQDDRLQAQALAGATIDSILESAGDRYLGRLLGAVFLAPEMLAAGDSRPALVRDVWLPSEDMQLMAARDQAGSSRGFYVAAWGAHNGQSHNHNDVGNFIVFADGRPVLVDVGVTTYTAKTFSSRRYEIWVMQSAYHNLPTVNGELQRAGSSAAARNVQYHATDSFAQLEMDLAAAYPETAEVERWTRTVRLNRGQDVVVTDDFQLRAVRGPSSQNLVTPCPVAVAGPGRLAFTLPAQAAGEGPQPTVYVEFDGTIFTPEIERIEIDDERLGPVWGDHLNRVMLRAHATPLQGRWTLRIKRP